MSLKNSFSHKVVATFISYFIKILHFVYVYLCLFFSWVFYPFHCIPEKGFSSKLNYIHSNFEMRKTARLKRNFSKRDGMLSFRRSPTERCLQTDRLLTDQPTWVKDMKSLQVVYKLRKVFIPWNDFLAETHLKVHRNRKKINLCLNT